MPFEEAHGLLPLPAQGRRLLDYGQINGEGVPSKGILFETRYGAQVVAACDGWVVHAGPVQGYGHLLLINAAHGYHMVLAGLAEFNVELGQFVVAGEPIGLMPRAGESRPLLYIELRKDHQPIDPDPWWRQN